MTRFTKIRTVSDELVKFIDVSIFSPNQNRKVGLLLKAKSFSPDDLDITVESKDFIGFDEAECLFRFMPSGLVLFEYTLPLHEEHDFYGLISETVEVRCRGTFSPHNYDIFNHDSDPLFRKMLKKETLARWEMANWETGIDEQLRNGSVSVTESFFFYPFK